ncbi:ATP-binding protein [Nocardia carnea]|uniref:ATP-binding protein n=1 Tax=Nocardia carnea TaxID=37328 RepID=UPI0032AEEDE3
MLANLVSNAIAHTPPGGKVVITAGRDDGHIWARVDDSGPGGAKSPGGVNTRRSASKSAGAPAGSPATASASGSASTPNW